MLEDLLLTKEEIPIFPYMSCVVPMCVFNVPIHHSLLSVDVKIDPKLANKLFPEAAREWYKDFQAYLTALEKSESEEDKEEKEKLKWYKEVFLPLGETVSIDLGRQCLGEIKLWQDLVAVTENGFARVLSINGVKLIKLRYRILLALLFPIILIILFIIGSFIVAIILLIIFILLLIYLFKKLAKPKAKYL